MGNDGGSIPTRRELVKEAARNPTAAELKESQQEQQEHLWTTDPISQKPLVRPVVSDSNGKLYNKETVLELLVEGVRKDEAERITLGAIKSLKDVVEVKFEVEPASESSDASDVSKREVWVCPVTGDRLGPGSKAVYIVPCGHVFSGTAIKEVSGEKCLSCETEYASNDVIPIISVSETDIARLALRTKTLREKGLTHSLKKASGGKKRKKGESTPAEAGPGEVLLEGRPAKTATPVNGADGSSAINNASTASLTAKVLREQENAKKRRLENNNVKSLFSNKDPNKDPGKKNDFMTRGYSVPTGSNR